MLSDRCAERVEFDIKLRDKIHSLPLILFSPFSPTSMRPFALIRLFNSVVSCRPVTGAGSKITRDTHSTHDAIALTLPRDKQPLFRWAITLTLSIHVCVCLIVLIMNFVHPVQRIQIIAFLPSLAGNANPHHPSKRYCHPSALGSARRLFAIDCRSLYLDLFVQIAPKAE